MNPNQLSHVFRLCYVFGSKLISEESTGMGVATGGGGRFPSGLKLWGNVPSEIAILKHNFLNIRNIFRFSGISKMKWAKSEEKSEFGGMWL